VKFAAAQRSPARLALGAIAVSVVSGCAGTASKPAVTAPPVAAGDSAVEPAPTAPTVVASDSAVLKDSAPVAPPPRLAALPDPVVRDDPKSRRGNSPYVVFGKHYQVMDSAAGYEEEGHASWYGTKFHGRTTSSGERYDMYELTAAHRSLPIPTYVRVTNLQNAKSSIVRVNDRGPFHPERIIDLSYAAAVKLGFERNGTARVRVETLQATSPPAPSRTSRQARFYLDTGIYANARSARGARDEVVALTARDASVVRVEGVFAVRIGPFATYEAAERLQSFLVFAERPKPVIILADIASAAARTSEPVGDALVASRTGRTDDK